VRESLEALSIRSSLTYFRCNAGLDNPNPKVSPPMFRTLTIALCVLLPAAAQATAFDIDPSHSAAQFTVKHMMISTVQGDFQKVSGSVTLDDKDPSKSSIDATIDASTIDTRDPKRDGHLKSPDFFDVAKFPNITFKSTSVKSSGANQLQVVGDLTMHGVTKPVTLDVSYTDAVKDPWGKTRRGAHATGKLNRKDFGLGWNKALDNGGVMVGEEVNLIIDVEAIAK
jgi:polyisoprenoid-binding protein YceI